MKSVQLTEIAKFKMQKFKYLCLWNFHKNCT